MGITHHGGCGGFRLGVGVAIIFFLFFFNRVGSKIVLKLIACFWPKMSLLLSPDQIKRG